MSPKIVRNATPLVAVLVLLLALVGCSPDEPTTEVADEEETETVEEAPAPDITIVATTSILGDIVTSIVGGDAEVEVLMGRGADPHHFEASPAQAQLLREADLVVVNGLELEIQLLGVLESAETDGAEIFRLGDHVDALRWDADDHDDDGHGHDHDDDGHDHGDDEDHDHDHGEYDPHVWLDPVRTADGLRALGERLAEVGGDAGDAWQQAAEAYADELLELDEEMAEILATVPDHRRMLVTDHHTLGYLADRYDFDVVGTVIPDVTTLAEPGARELRDLAELIDELGVPAIFAETAAPTRLADAIAAEADRDVEVVDINTESLGEEGSGAETYPAMLRTAAERIADALTG